MANSSSARERPFKIIAGADDFGADLKDSVVAHLRSLNFEVEDLETTAYYSAAAEVSRRVSASPSDTRGVLACGTGAGVAIAANKFPTVSAATCLSAADAANARSINNCNVLALSGMSTSKSSAVEIVEAWLDTPFKSPCPASGDKPWPEEIQSFLDKSLSEIPKVAGGGDSGCSICCLVKSREFSPIEPIPGGSMKIVRETPTSAIVRFKAGSVEPAHHHTFGHDVMVMKGKKTVWNLSKKERFDLSFGDYLFTPARDVHRVLYIEDTEFFIKWEGQWDLIFDEDSETAKKNIAAEEGHE